METELKKWVLEMRECDVCVDGDTIKAKATEIYDNIHPATGPVDLYFNDICGEQREAFEASSGWLSNFCRRNSLSYRNHWYIIDPHAFTKNLNMKSPGYLKSSKWLSKVWSKFEC